VQHDRDLWVKIELFLWFTPWDKRLLRISSQKNSFGRFRALLIVVRCFLAQYSIIGIFRRTKIGNDDILLPTSGNTGLRSLACALSTPFPPCTRLGALAKPCKVYKPPEAPSTPQPVAPPTNTELGRVDARCCEVWSLHTSDSECSPAACVENIDSRLESLDEGLRLHDRLCVEEEGRDTAAMVTCKSRASLAATPAAFACESLATVACKSSAATSDIVACESAAAVACESSRRHPPPSPASPRSLSPASARSLSPASPWSLSAAGPRSLSPARPRPPLPASHVRDHCEHPPRMRLNKRSVRGHRPPQGAFARAHSTLSLLLQNPFLLLLLPLLLWLPSRSRFSNDTTNV